MDQTLLVVEPQQSCFTRACFDLGLCLKISGLVAFTYGLMVLMFFVCLKIETMNGTIPGSYITGGAIILGIFVANVIFWGVLWCWGARKREFLRREIVERQLAMIRREQEAQQAADIQEERKMIEQKRNRGR